MSTTSAIQKVQPKTFCLKHCYTWHYVGKVNRVHWRTGGIHSKPEKFYRDPLSPIKPVYHSVILGLNASKKRAVSS